ncbi:thioredoxin family protein [Gracilibacillus phocaeensis]|uniref:thioredoxin family protein n=1 Tax=Gracilibacillus phocaeensis TaxID=2042304 RepID=UPI00103031A3|nr:thioredoxin family protein [Gracilibacillus phocaeensis]
MAYKFKCHFIHFLLAKYRLVEQLEGKDIQFLTITEDWCGDAMMINPVIRKIAEAADIESRVVLRDENADLIDRHLTNGGRAIPIVLILNSQGEVIGKWGPRAPEVQEMVDKARATLPPKEDPSFEERQKEFISKLTTSYREDATFWQYVYDSFKKTLLSVWA